MEAATLLYVGVAVAIVVVLWLRGWMKD